MDIGRRGGDDALMPDMILVSAGVAACATSFAFWRMERKNIRAHEAWCAAAAKTDGVVSRTARRGAELSRNEPTDDDAIALVPIVRFTAANGVEYEFDAPGAPRDANARVQVAYDPALPSSARMVERQGKPGCTVLLLIAGVCLIAAGILRGSG